MSTRRTTPIARWLSGAALALTVAVGVGACSSPTQPAAEAVGTVSAPGKGSPSTLVEAGSSDDASSNETAPSGDEAGAPAANRNGTVTIVSLGDSLTAGEGEDPARGFTARIEESLKGNGKNSAPAINLGRSGWTSQDLLDGADGERGQVPAAKELIAEAKQAGSDVVATVLIGSNDLWALYRNEDPTSADDERQDLARYRRNLEQTVSALRGAGAQVVIGINDDQSKRPVMTDQTLRENTLPGITQDEVGKMSAQGKRYAEVVRDIAKKNDLRVADFLEARLFSDSKTLAEDGVHPNARGYDEMAKVWLAALETGR